MKKIKLFSLSLAIIITLSACSESANESKNLSENILEKIELIDNNNRDRIGEEISSNQVVMRPDGALAEESESPDVGQEIPENNIIQSLASDSVLPGTSIQEIEVLRTNITPELIGPNGAIGVFTKGEAEGWNCKAGDSITWSFEKYPLNNGNSQALAVGYVKDGTMYKAQVFQDELIGTYRVDIVEDGSYFIYFLCASSDSISLKEGEIIVDVS